jgi:multimeric flavodoxin WrbA
LSKKILAIIASPTRDEGYTFRSAQALEEQLQARGSIDFEYVFLADRPFSPCQGHLTCISSGESACPFRDEISSMQAAMERADAVVFASPVHIFNASALMKQMFDLFVFQMHRPTFFGKQAIVIAAGAGAGQKTVVDYLEKTVKIWGFEVTGRLGTHAGFFDEDKYRKKLLRQTEKLAEDLLAALDHNEIARPGVAELINFRVWRSVITRTRDDSPYDWNYWQEKGWLERSYYVDVPMNPFANALAGLVERMIAYAIRNVSVGPVK